MSEHKRWRPPLKSSLSMPGDEKESLSHVRRKLFTKKQSFQNVLPTPSENEEEVGSSSFQNEEHNGHLENDNTEVDDEANVKAVWRRLRTHKKEAPFKDTPFMKAIRENDTNQMQTLIDSGTFTIDEEDENNLTPFLYACQIGHLETILMLIQLGCDVNSSNSQRCNGMHSAARIGKSEVVSYLLEQGVSPETREKVNGRSAIHEAVLSSNLITLKVIVDKLKEDSWEAQRVLRISDKKGRTPLHLAAYESLPGAIDLLLSAGADVAATDNEGLTPMHANLLSHRGKRRCGGVLTQLLEAGGDVEVTERTNGERLSHFASKVGCAKCLEFLHKRGAELEATDNQWRTPLHVAAWEDQIDTLVYLISNGVNIEAMTKENQTPLFLAVMSDGPKVIEKLLSAGADPNKLNMDDKSYVQIAILRRKRQAFEALVKLKAVQLPQEANEDVLHYCTALGFSNLMTHLLENGWDINIKDGKGRTPLHRSLNHGHEIIATMLINMEAGIHETDDTGATPLHYAVRWGGSDAILRLLLKKKAKLSIQDRLGRTPLHYAASKFSIMSDLYILLGGGSAIDTKDNMGLTPLHLAARLGNESLVRILLENGAKHDVQDVYQFLPIDHAKEKGHKSIIKRLRDHDAMIHPEKYINVEDLPSEIDDENEPKPGKKDHRKSVAW